MKTKKQLTYILLEKGSEDIGLLRELRQITIQAKVKGSREFIEKYPLIWDLILGLENEIREEYQE